MFFHMLAGMYSKHARKNILNKYRQNYKAWQRKESMSIPMQGTASDISDIIPNMSQIVSVHLS